LQFNILNFVTPSNGVPSFSPGLARNAGLPWVNSEKSINPERVASNVGMIAVFNHHPFTVGDRPPGPFCSGGTFDNSPAFQCRVRRINVTSPGGTADAFKMKSSAST
jgi:hypothetical protein